MKPGGLRVFARRPHPTQVGRLVAGASDPESSFSLTGPSAPHGPLRSSPSPASQSWVSIASVPIMAPPLQPHADLEGSLRLIVLVRSPMRSRSNSAKAETPHDVSLQALPPKKAILLDYAVRRG